MYLYVHTILIILLLGLLLNSKYTGMTPSYNKHVTATLAIAVQMLKGFGWIMIQKGQSLSFRSKELTTIGDIAIKFGKLYGILVVPKG